MRFDLRVDVLELRVAIGKASAFLALAIDLTPIAEAFEQLGNPARGNAMSHVAQRRGEFGVAFRHPQQRCIGSPSVAGSSNCRRSSSSVGSLRVSGNRLPPARGIF